jgi:hypothetical protein
MEQVTVTNYNMDQDDMYVHFKSEKKEYKAKFRMEEGKMPRLIRIFDKSNPSGCWMFKEKSHNYHDDISKKVYQLIAEDPLVRMYFLFTY